MILIIIWGITIAISFTLVILSIVYKINDWNSEDITLVFLISLVPIFNFAIIAHGFPDIIEYFKNKKEIDRQKDLEDEKIAFSILDEIDIKYIERYLRKKKLKKL